MQQDRSIDLEGVASAVGAEPCTALDKGANPERRLELTAYVSAKDVQQALGCSMSHAYAHLRRATGKTGRGMLRAPVEVWEAYAHRVYGRDDAAVSKVNVVKGDRSRQLAPSGVNDDEHGDRLRVIEKRLDEAYRLLGELRGAVQQ